jgi:hypothetical protein
MAKTPAQLEREIAEALSDHKRPKSKARGQVKARGHELFYVSEDQQGGKSAEHFERFDTLAEAIDTLARLPVGSITYGNAADGPKFMIVWAAPAQTDLLYWTDGDLNVQSGTQLATKEIRNRQAPRGARSGPHGSEQYFNDRFEKARLKAGHAHATKRSKRGAPRVVHVEAATPAGYRWLRMNARGATVTPEGFAVTDEAAWAQSLSAAGAREI